LHSHLTHMLMPHESLEYAAHELICASFIHQLQREPIFSSLTWLTCKCDITHSNVRHTNSYVLHYSTTTTRAHLFAVSLDSHVNATWITEICGSRTQISSLIHQLPRELIFCSLTWLKCQCDITHSNVRHTNSYFLHSFMSPSFSVPSVNTTWIIQTCGNFAYCVSILNQLLYAHPLKYAKYAHIVSFFHQLPLINFQMSPFFFMSLDTTGWRRPIPYLYRSLSAKEPYN